VSIEDDGSLFLFHLLTDAARSWVETHVTGEHTMYDDSLVVEHRYAEDLAAGMIRDGLEVR